MRSRAWKAWTAPHAVVDRSTSGERDAVAASIAWTAAQWAGDDDRGPLDELVSDLGVLLVRGVDGGLGVAR